MSEIYLAHHGIKGQRWGVRRYQNEDGSLTSAGKRRIGITEKGNIGLITSPSSSKAKKKFAVKTAISVGTISASVYLSRHPEAIKKGFNYVSKRSSESSSDLIKKSLSTSHIYSEVLGRMLTIDEIRKMGFDL